MQFINKYNHPKNIRFESFKFTLFEAKKRGLKTVVETGCARGKTKFIFFSKINWKDGKQEGLAVGWHENGQKAGESNWKDGKKVSAKYWNSKGEPEE